MDIFNISHSDLLKLNDEYHPTGLYYYCNFSYNNITVIYIIYSKVNITIDVAEETLFMSIKSKDFPEISLQLIGKDINFYDGMFDIFSTWVLDLPNNASIGHMHDNLYINQKNYNNELEHSVFGYDVEKFIEKARILLSQYKYIINITKIDLKACFENINIFFQEYSRSQIHNKCTKYDIENISYLFKIFMDEMPDFPLSFKYFYKHNEPNKITYKHIEKDLQDIRERRRKTYKDYKKQEKMFI